MPSVCFYFQVHQPFRVKKYSIFQIGNDHDYFNDRGDGKLNNGKIFEKVARKCYLPTNEMMLRLLDRHPEFKISYSLSGVFLEQAERYAPEVLNSFYRLVQTGRVELLSETYYHSLAALYSFDEFERQVAMHRALIRKFFGVTPTVFRNTELIYSNEIARYAERLGFSGILAEGADDILGWRSPNFVYKPKGTDTMKLLLKNYKLSDDIAFRFSSRDWLEWPLTAEKFARWVSEHNGNGEVVNLFMDYETFGEHQWESTGIFDFLRELPGRILGHADNDFKTPSEAIAAYPARDELDVLRYVSWADIERDLSAWRSNAMQEAALGKLYQLEREVLSSGDEQLMEDWRKLQTSDHFYYMCTKWFADGDVHKYFNPYDSPYEAFIAHRNVLEDLHIRIKKVEVI
ncbi:alpha-amylase [Candidatus Azambacteria bacterium RIFCSPHIGHO2_02_FULL_52_12]|uniref:Alpha-amylase n=1 Tax=Candidatus Azambacteria bacterium RIFCSPLOWO2_01_FULL_46_25 TaxID=1797298 RepID=A0A1F5BW46_9BACT|nr:MAG: alpha-amylase [Candidatus Azambacteria bacterium RIFCSPHIGHO2_02_FULL_52_12]OGD34829.1 MAG: alpha-amylase [Candidatus Azambacteria bacterium RIFCSPLOWO2_01_FULL_46_25]OGD36445.1 MAG: alpha-amylase [Candidatus Azambacteria bacterium RIFCSPHIGHO2_01_FULL_51_74]